MTEADRRAAPMLELVGVRAAYGRIEVLHGVDLAVPRGAVVALLGPNGGGKTTTLKVASGQMPATAGCLHIGGRHVNGVAPDALARIGVCTIPEGRGIFPNLTVRENLRMVTFGGVEAADVEERAFSRFPRLGERRQQLAGTMSGGEQQMLAMARGLAVNPSLLFLDELSMGLAPLIVEELYEIVGPDRPAAACRSWSSSSSPAPCSGWPTSPRSCCTAASTAIGSPERDRPRARGRVPRRGALGSRAEVNGL